MTAFHHGRDIGAAIRFALTPRIRPDRMSETEIVLDLFRGAAPLSRTTLACVDRKDVPGVMLRCRRDLERRGFAAVGPAPVRAPTTGRGASGPDPRDSLPVAAFDWMFEAG